MSSVLKEILKILKIKLTIEKQTELGHYINKLIDERISLIIISRKEKEEDKQKFLRSLDDEDYT